MFCTDSSSSFLAKMAPKNGREKIEKSWKDLIPKEHADFAAKTRTALVAEFEPPAGGAETESVYKSLCSASGPLGTTWASFKTDLGLTKWNSGFARTFLSFLAGTGKNKNAFVAAAPHMPEGTAAAFSRLVKTPFFKDVLTVATAKPVGAGTPGGDGADNDDAAGDEGAPGDEGTPGVAGTSGGAVSSGGVVASGAAVASGGADVAGHGAGAAGHGAAVNEGDADAAANPPRSKEPRLNEAALPGDYTDIWPGKSEADWAIWNRIERTSVFEDFNPKAWERRREGERGKLQASTQFERQVAFLFRTQLGFLDVQRGFNGAQGGDVDLAGPKSRVIVECKDHSTSVNADFLNKTYGSWTGGRHIHEESDWHKCFVAKNGFVVVPPHLDAYFCLFSVSQDKLVPENTNAKALMQSRVNALTRLNDGYRSWMMATELAK